MNTQSLTQSLPKECTQTDEGYHLDVRRLLCPLPVIRLQQTIRFLSHQNIVTMTASDPGVLHDVPAWCKIHGHTVVTTTQNNREIFLKILVNKTEE